MNKKINTPTVPSYTFEPTSNPNIKRFVDRKGDWTHYWLVKEKKFVMAVNHILELGHSKGPNFKQYLARSSQEEIKQKMEEKGDEGSRTHDAIKDLIDGIKVTKDRKYATELRGGRQEVLNDDEWDNLMGFHNWCKKYQPRVVEREYPLAGADFAGTMDALLVITIPAGDKEFDKAWWGKDILILIDWKSSASIWFEYEAQTAAYWEAAKLDKKFSKFIKSYEGNIFTGVVRLGTLHKSKYQFVAWTQKETEREHFTRFRASQFIARRYEPDFLPEIVNIPTHIFIKMPKAKIGAKKKAKVITKNNVI